jgi:EmrB/QacA subfamily drug resistance transporter
MTFDSRRTALLLSSMAAFITPFMVSSVNLALPVIGREYSLDALLMSWVATSYILSAAMLLIPFGRLADIHGRKKMFTSGAIVYAAASFLMVLAPNGASLIAFRTLQGVGGAMIFSTSTAILISSYPLEQRGRVLGINAASVYLGLSVGPFLGGMMTHQLGWRSVFILIGFLCIAMVILTKWRLKEEWKEAKGEGFDIAGTVLYGAAMILFMLGFTTLPQATGIVMVAGGMLLLGIFLIWENRFPSPIVNIALFRHNIVFAFSNLAALINYSATYAITFLLSLYLQYIKGLSPQSAGMLLIAQPLVMTVVSPLAGRLSDRIEPRIVSSIGMALIVVGLTLCVFIQPDTTYLYLIPTLMLLGFGFALFSSPNTNAVMSSVEKKFYGVAAASLGTMRLTGQMMSMGIVMLFFAVNIGKVKITPAQFPSFLISMKYAFVVFSILCAFGVFFSLVRGNVRKAV